MREVILFSIASALALALTGCGTTGGGSAGTQQPGIGPFDSQGRYREEWADNPSQWRRPGAQESSLPTTDVLPEIAQVEQPPPNSVPLAQTRTSTTTKPAPVVVRTSPTPQTVKAAAKPKPKVAAKPKPKPVVRTYTVKKGDTLSAIASRNGTSVGALQRANGISGSLIRPGQTLKIPR